MSPLDPSQLSQFIGSEHFYRHAFIRAVIYTDGIQYLAQHGNCYWLLDAIGSHLISPEFKQAAAKDERLSLLSFWKLAVSPNRTAKLTAIADSDEPPFVTQDIDFTDFPLDSIDIWAANNGEGYTLMLPSEY